jgi:hypothetical protein
MEDKRDQNDQKLFEALFHQLVFSLNEAAMMQMGKMVNPMTQQIERNLLQAQNSIDLLRMLKEKTQGNLNEHERRLIDDAVMGLQVNYAYESEHGPGEK